MYNMQDNPSFNQSYGYDVGGGGGGGGGAYHDRGSSHQPRRGKTGVSAGGDTLSNFDQRHHFESELHNIVCSILFLSHALWTVVFNQKVCCRKLCT